jgi:gamma-glutamylcyclotransferase (GGCT)/AIG2-like uncharacterized protein YtfP
MTAPQPALFVYGLFKPGFSLHHVVAPFVVRAHAARTRGRLYEAGYPAARFDEDGTVEGFVLWLDPARADEALAVCDDAEDEGEMYRRVVIEALTGEDVVDAFAYEYLLPLHGARRVGTIWPAGG